MSIEQNTQTHPSSTGEATSTALDLSEWSESETRADRLVEQMTYCLYGDDVEDAIRITHVAYHGDSILITGVTVLDGDEAHQTLDRDEVVLTLTRPQGD